MVVDSNCSRKDCESVARVEIAFSCNKVNENFYTLEIPYAMNNNEKNLAFLLF